MGSASLRTEGYHLDLSQRMEGGWTSTHSQARTQPQSWKFREQQTAQIT